MQQRLAHELIFVINTLAVYRLCQRSIVAVKDLSCLLQAAAAGDMRVVGLVDPVLGVYRQLNDKKADTDDKSNCKNQNQRTAPKRSFHQHTTFIENNE